MKNLWLRQTVLVTDSQTIWNVSHQEHNVKMTSYQRRFYLRVLTLFGRGIQTMIHHTMGLVDLAKRIQTYKLFYPNQHDSSPIALRLCVPWSYFPRGIHSNLLQTFLIQYSRMTPAVFEALLLYQLRITQSIWSIVIVLLYFVPVRRLKMFVSEINQHSHENYDVLCKKCCQINIPRSCCFLGSNSISDLTYSHCSLITIVSNPFHVVYKLYHGLFACTRDNPLKGLSHRTGRQAMV